MNRIRRNFLQASLCIAMPSLASAKDTPFAPSQSVAALEQFALQRKQLLQSLSAGQLVDLMLSFYGSARPVGLAPGSDADMLLYQWGTYDWGQGRFFEFDITRQFIRQVNDIRIISQLSLKANFSPSAALEAIRPGNRWLEAAEQLSSFSEFIRTSAAYRAVAFIRPKSIVHSWSLV